MVLSIERWLGKVAIVTGASSGIGAAVTEQLVEKGLQVAALDIRKDRLDELVPKFAGKKGKFLPIKADVSKEEDILNSFKWIKDNLGPIHILINNAGVYQYTSMVDGDTQLWRNTFDVNVIGMSICTREAIRDMRANNVDGHIVYINSIAGHQVPNIPYINVYSATKHAITALVETVRLELNSLKLKIKTTSISPGLVDSDMVPAEFKDKQLYEDGKIIEAEQIADGIFYALSTPPHVQIQELTIRPIIDFT